MKTSTVVWVVVIILVLGGAWYLWKDSSMTPYSAAPSATTDMQGMDMQATTTEPAVAPVVTVANDATLGDYLVAANGMTLYRYTKDTTAVSNCTGSCAVSWPPYIHATTTDPLIGGTGVTGMLATIARADGSQQIIYNGMPLYFWKNDKKPGDTTGQGVGGVWFVVKP